MNTAYAHSRKHPPLIDLDAIPNPVLKALMPLFGPLLRKLFAIDAINDVHDRIIETATDETFFSRVLQLVGARYEVSETDLERIPATGPVVVVSNHPLGGLDGIILGELLRHRRKDTKLMANFLLKRVRHADAHMFFVDPFPRDEAVRANFAGLRDCMKHLKQGGLLGVFPGNRVSHWQWDRQAVCDPAWVANVAALVRRAAVPVVPLFIEGGNSLLFNLAGIIHPLLRTMLLAREFIRQGRDPEPVKLHIGTPIPFTRLKKFEKDEDMIAYLRLATYMLGNRPEPAPAEQIAEIAKAQGPEPLAPRLPGELLQADVDALPEEALLLTQGDFQVYLARHAQLPNVMQEIGRGREEAFRDVGGGTLKALDLAPQDEYYHHLFLWHTKDRAVVGAYRLGLSDEILARHGPEGLICSGLFDLKPEFLAHLNPGIELGRSYVLPEYQRNYNSLSLLWSGILNFIARNPQYRRTFGSVGISQGNEYTPASRTLIVNFMREQFSHPTLSLQVEPRTPFQGVKLSGLKPEEISSLVQNVEEVSALVTGLEDDGKGVPILIKHYLRMNAKLISFGVWENHSHALVSFIVVDLTESEPKFVRRYMGAESYTRFMAYHGLSMPETPEAS